MSDEFEQPTEPQIKLAKKLGIEHEGSSKKGLSEKISAKLEANKKDKGGKPSESKKTSQEGSKRGFEAHLSVENTRTNALNTALEVLKSGVFNAEGNLEDLAKRFERYFLTGEF